MSRAGEVIRGNGSSRKFATTIAPSFADALYGIATKLVLPIVPFANVNVLTESGNRPAIADTAASDGLNEIIMSISPSFRS